MGNIIRGEMIGVESAKEIFINLLLLLLRELMWEALKQRIHEPRLSIHSFLSLSKNQALYFLSFFSLEFKEG